MSRPVAVCQASDNLNQAAKLMWDADCGAIPVVDSQGRAVGMVTDRDICMAAYTQGKRLHEIRVYTAMSKVLVSCRSSDPLQKIEQLMIEHQIRRLPVLDEEGRPIGIVSLNDLARIVNRQHATAPGGGNGVSATSMGHTLAAICAPRLSDAGPKLA